MVISNACVPTRRTSQPARNASSPAAQSKKPCVRPDPVVKLCQTSSILTLSSCSKMAAKGLQSPVPKHRACNLASRHCLGHNRGTLCCAQIFVTLANQGQYYWMGRLDHPLVIHTADPFDNHARTKYALPCFHVHHLAMLIRYLQWPTMAWAPISGLSLSKASPRCSRCVSLGL